NSLTYDLMLPPFPVPQMFTYKIVGIDPAGASVPVGGATCQFAADISDPYASTGTTATFAATAQTDSLGKASALLIPASQAKRTYQVVIVPPPGSLFQTTYTQLELGPSPGVGEELAVPLRPVLTGRVFDLKGMPFADVSVVPQLAQIVVAAQAIPQLAQLE